LIILVQLLARVRANFVEHATEVDETTDSGVGAANS